MRAVRVGDLGLELVERDPRPLHSGEVRVSVIASPITGLDRDVAAGLAEFRGVPGHAFVGRVVDADYKESD